jgi:hypothetical protein
MRGPEGASVQQCTGATRHALEPFIEAEGEVAGLLQGPLAGRVRGDAGEVHPASAVLDGHQDTYSLLSSTVSTCRKSTARLPAA